MITFLKRVRFSFFLCLIITSLEIHGISQEFLVFPRYKHELFQQNTSKKWNIPYYYPTLLPRVQISRETSTNNRYLYSSHSSRPREVQNLGKSEFWEKKSLDNKSLIRRFGV